MGISVDTRIGDYTCVQEYTVIGHDAVVGSWCQINSHCTIAGGASSGTATIAAVSDKAVVIPCGVRGTGSTSVDDFMVTVVLTNSTTVTAQRGGSPAMNVVVAYQVQDYY